MTRGLTPRTREYSTRHPKVLLLPVGRDQVTFGVCRNPAPAPGESTNTVYSFLLCFHKVTVLDSLYISNKTITYLISCTSLENAK